jgi:hypothetical protein
MKLIWNGANGEGERSAADIIADHEGRLFNRSMLKQLKENPAEFARLTQEMHRRLHSLSPEFLGEQDRSYLVRVGVDVLVEWGEVSAEERCGLDRKSSPVNAVLPAEHDVVNFRAELNRAFKELSKEQQAALILLGRERRTAREAARAMGCTSTEVLRLEEEGKAQLHKLLWPRVTAPTGSL